MPSVVTKPSSTTMTAQSVWSPENMRAVPLLRAVTAQSRVPSLPTSTAATGGLKASIDSKKRVRPLQDREDVVMVVSDTDA